MNIKTYNKKRKTSHQFFILYSLFFIPSLALAFPGSVKDFVENYFLKTAGLLGPILIGLAFLAFFWGVAKFILAAGNEKELAAGRQFMIWGVLALFILITFWGIMQFLSTQFDFGPIHLPLLPNDTSSTQVKY